MTSGLAAFAVLAWLAYLASRLLARRNVPELVGFLLVGAALGPSGVGMLSKSELASLAPVTEIALAILMFVIGERVSVRALRATRWAVSSGIFQYVLAGLAVYGVSISLDASRTTALILASLAGAGAPLTIAAIVTSAKASGRYADGLVSSHAVCDALAATTFAAVLPVATLLADDTATVSEAVGNFVQLGIGGAVLGVTFGLLIARFGYQIETSGELLLFVLVHLLVGWALSDWLDISLPLAALVAGGTAATRAPAEFSARLFRTMKSIEQPLYLLFFALAGASIHLEDVPKVGLVGVGYLLTRGVTKLVGGFLGGVVGGLGWRDATRLGIDSIPQAGVAVGLAVLSGEVLPDAGTEAATVVLGSVVIFELVGPLLVARGLAGGKRKVDAAPSTAHEAPPTPSTVVLAAQRPIDVPTWLLDDCERWGAKLVAVLPSSEPDAVDALRITVAKAGVEVETRNWVQGESFTGSVVRTVEDVGAGMVAMSARPPSNVGGGSRLVLLPHERIARQVTCPVILLPYRRDDEPVEDADPVRPGLFGRLRRRRSSPTDSDVPTEPVAPSAPARPETIEPQEQL